MNHHTAVLQKLTSIILLVFVLTRVGYSQHIFIERLTLSDGLPSLEINDIEQTKDGRIWIAHRNGISSFDGIRFTNHSITDGLKQPYQNMLCLCPENTLYSISNDREIIISKLSINKWDSIPSPTIFPQNNRITGFEAPIIDGKKHLIISEKFSGIYFYNKEWHNISDTVLNCVSVNGLIRYQKKILIATSNGFKTFDGERVSTAKNIIIPGGHKNIKAIYRVDDNSAIFLADNVLFSLDNNNCTKLGTIGNIDLEGKNSEVQISKNIFGDIFLGDATQLYRIKTNPFQINEIDYTYQVTTEGVKCLFEDDFKNTWVGSHRGISIFRPSVIKNFFKENGLPENEVTCIQKISDNKYLLGHNMGLSVFDGEEVTKYIKISEETNYNVRNRVLDITTDYNGTVWFASTSQGIGELKNGKITWIENQFLKNANSYYSVLYDTLTNRLWIATNSGIGYLDKKKDFHQLNAIKEKSRKIFQLRDNNIYLATIESGIIVLDSNNIIKAKIHHGQGKEENNVYSMFLDDQDILWVGTNMGLRYCINDKIFESLDGMPVIHDPVFQINEDNGGFIWIGTDESVMRYDGIKLLDFTSYEGYKSSETNRDAFGITEDGNVMIGGSGGLSVFFTDQMDMWNQTRIPDCEITGIQVDSTLFNPHKEITFSYNENSILISFTPIIRSGRNNVLQQIMLAGLDDSWKTIDDRYIRTAFYSNLPAGTYNFMYRVSNDDGRTWCRADISSNIVIQYPFWQRWYFVFIILAVLIIVTLLISYLITRSRYTKDLEKEVQNRTQELQKANDEKDIFFSIIAHDLKSPFNAIIGFADILKNDFDSFNEEEKKLFIDNIYEASHNTYKLIEKLLDWSRAKTGRLSYQPVKIDLSLVASNMIATYRNVASKKDITIKSYINYQSIVYADQNLLETVFRNLISNAIKYSNPGGVIKIKAQNDNEYTYISIEDQGIGMSDEEVSILFSIDKRSSTPGTQDETGTGLGLLVCKEFCEVNKGSLIVNSKKGKGSTFKFSIPNNGITE